MKLALRNYMRVRDASFAIGEKQPKAAAFMFTVNQVVEVTGFSANTVRKYLSEMVSDGVIREIVVSKSVTIYKFEKSYLMGITGDRLSTYQGR